MRSKLAMMVALGSLLGCGVHMPRLLDDEASGDVELPVESPDQEKKDNDGIPLNPDPKPVEPPALSNCDSPGSEVNLAEGQIDGRQIFLTTEAIESLSLCQSLIASDKDIGIFQLSSILCFTCQDEATFLEEELSARGYREKVLHSVVFTDAREDWGDDDFNWFMDTFAPSASRLHDDGLKVIKLFSVNPNSPRLPTIIVMNRRMQAIVLNEDGTDGQDILAAVEVLQEKGQE